MLITLIATVITLGVIVFIHELGHFMAAKISNVRVERFSMGFGPVLLKVRGGETEYCISAIPFGGYLRMAGDDPEEVAELAAEQTERGETPSEDRGFLSKSKLTRAFIIAAGPTMNFLLAMLIYTGLVAYMGVGVMTTRQVGGVIDGTPAREAGLAEGDLIVSVDGVKVDTWDNMLDLLDTRLGTVTGMVVERDGRPLAITLDLSSAEGLYDIGLYDYRPAVVGDVKLGGPAAGAGLKTGDRIIRVDGEEISSWSGLSQAIRGFPEAELEIEWERAGEILSSTVTPVDIGGFGKIEIYGAIEKRKAGPLEALKRGFDTTIWVAKQLFLLPRMILRGTAVRDVVGGPVRIGELAGESMRWGASAFLGFIAAISAQLCLVNLLPIPVLDGGHLLILGVEAVRRKAISVRQRVIAQQIGFAFLMALMVLVTLVDVSRFLGD